MKETIAILLGVSVTGLLLARDSQVPVRSIDVDSQYTSFSVVDKFVDPDNGNVCYLVSAGYKGGISCVKP